MANKINHAPGMFSDPNTWFLGGTCATSTWRRDLIPLLAPHINYFDPQLGPGEWNAEAQALEDKCKAVSKQVYVLSPESISPYSGFEVAVKACQDPEGVVFAYVGDFPEALLKSVQKIAKDLSDMGVHVFDNLIDLAEYLNA